MPMVELNASLAAWARPHARQLKVGLGMSKALVQAGGEAPASGLPGLGRSQGSGSGWGRTS
eukprot:121866-Chlamydomonas_euryale.AAC.1